MNVSSVHWLPPQNVTLVCRFVPVVTVTFFASHEYWGRYHAPSKILPNTSLVHKLSDGNSNTFYVISVTFPR